MSRKILSLGLLSFLAFSPSVVSASQSQSECYSNIGDLKVHMGSTFQSLGMCQSHCAKQDLSVYGVKGDRCWCGDKLPPISAKVSQKECNEPCPGYPSDNCGGDDAWTIIYDSSTNPEHSKPQSSSSSEPKSSSSTSEPKATLSVNPNLVATGAAMTQTSIPNSILTAPTTAPKNADVAEPSALAATQASSSSSSSSSSASSSADPESSSNGAMGPTSPAAVGSVVGAILLPLVLGSAF